MGEPLGSPAGGGPLAGLRVLELSRDIAGAYCGKLLADAGAQVVRVEPADGEPARRRTTFGQAPDGADTAALFRYLHAGKRPLAAAASVADLVRQAAGADIVIDESGVGAVPVAALREALPHLVLVSITPFGTTGPWAERPATDFTLQALSGSTASRGRPDRGPVQAGGRQGAWTAGVYAAVAALAAARRARRTGEGEHVDVSAYEAMLVTQNSHMYLYPQLGAPRQTGAVRYVDLPSISPAKDGFIGFCLVTAQQFAAFLRLIERPDLIDDAELVTFAGRRARHAEFEAIVSAWTGRHTIAEIVARADALRVPAVPVATPHTVTDIDHFRERGVFVPNPHGFRQPRVPYSIEGLPRGPVARTAPPASPGATTPQWGPAARPAGGSDTAGGLPLEGLRVVDLTAFWAGPSATQLLGALGADVIKVEAVSRPDLMRATTTRPGGDSWWEYGPVFHGTNTGKRGVTLDLTTADGRELLRGLVERADMVIENFTPRVLDNLEIPPRRLREWNPGALIVRMPAFGLDGPWRDRPGFAMTMEQVSGLATVTGEPELPPMLPRSSDPIAGMHAALATLIALEQRDRTGRGPLVEVPMIESVLSVAAEAIVEASAYGRTAERAGNRDHHIAPQGVYRCSGDEQWIAISVEDDAQWAALCAALGDAVLTSLPGVDDVRGRHASHDRIDTELARILSERDRDETVELLCGRGVPAAPVLASDVLPDNPQTTARGFLERVTHPVAGPLLVPGMPFRFAGRRDKEWLTRPAPALGKHNDEVLGELLGLTTERLTALRAAGVIGEAVPAGPS